MPNLSHLITNSFGVWRSAGVRRNLRFVIVRLSNLKIRQSAESVVLWTLSFGRAYSRSRNKSSAWIYRPSFRENKPKTLGFSHRKRAFWAGFRENWVYKFGHCSSRIYTIWIRVRENINACRPHKPLVIRQISAVSAQERWTPFISSRSKCYQVVPAFIQFELFLTFFSLFKDLSAVTLHQQQYCRRTGNYTQTPSNLKWSFFHEKHRVTKYCI